MSSLDDRWFAAVLKACYNNPREDREARRRQRVNNNACSLPLDRDMVKPRKGGSGGSSKRSTPGRTGGDKGGSSRSKKDGKDSPPGASSGKSDRRGAGEGSSKDAAAHGDFDIVYAVRQSLTMFQGKDDKYAARALFPRGHPDVTGANILTVGKENNMRLTTSYLDYMGLLDDSIF